MKIYEVHEYDYEDDGYNYDSVLGLYSNIEAAKKHLEWQFKKDLEEFVDDFDATKFDEDYRFIERCSDFGTGRDYSVAIIHREIQDSFTEPEEP